MKAIGYHRERQHWKEFKEKVSNAHAEIIVKKLARHFKLPIHTVHFHGYKDSGSASSGWGRIRLSNNPSIGLICHEVNHFLCWKKFGTRSIDGKKAVRHGTKKWCRQLQVIINYANKMNYWKEELERRTTPKPPKPEPTKEEIRLQKVGLLEKRKQDYERKIRLSQNRIKKANRKISGLKRFL